MKRRWWTINIKEIEHLIGKEVNVTCGGQSETLIIATITDDWIFGSHYWHFDSTQNEKLTKQYDYAIPLQAVDFIIFPLETKKA